jgi:hypothetical protein
VQIIYGFVSFSSDSPCSIHPSQLTFFQDLTGLCSIFYSAMFDELDESTNMMPSEPLTRNLPKEKTFLALDADGEHLPDDWYLYVSFPFFFSPSLVH